MEMRVWDLRHAWRDAPEIKGMYIASGATDEPGQLVEWLNVGK